MDVKTRIVYLPENLDPESAPEPEPELPPIRVVMSPEDTKGKWKPFTEYVSESVRIDGWTDAEGVRYVPARAGEHPDVRVVFSRFKFLAPIDLVLHDRSQNVKSARTKVRRAQREQTKRGL